MAKYRYINVYECCDYDEDEDEDEDKISIRYNPKIETLINGCYFFLLKLLKMHRYKEAINIIFRMKAMQVTIYEDEYIENDYEYIDVENEDDLDELSEGNFVSKINYLHLAFKESDMQDIDLKLAYVSKNPALAIAKSLCEYDFYDTDLSFLINEYKLDVEQVNILLFQIEKELFYIDKTKLINLFIPVGRLTIDLSSFFLLSYELIDKNKDMYYAFDSSNSNTILKYAPLFLDEDNNSFISLARIIFEATIKEDDENLILK